MISPRTRMICALVLFVICAVAWPMTALTVFKDEPQGILGLSWLSIILQAVAILATTDIRESQAAE